jgi:hypothetical protein
VEVSNGAMNPQSSSWSRLLRPRRQHQSRSSVRPTNLVSPRPTTMLRETLALGMSELTLGANRSNDVQTLSPTRATDERRSREVWECPRALVACVPGCSLCGSGRRRVGYCLVAEGGLSRTVVSGYDLRPLADLAAVVPLPSTFSSSARILRVAGHCPSELLHPLKAERSPIGSADTRQHRPV